MILILALSMAIPLLVILGIFWLCTLQLSPRVKDAVQRKLSTIILARLRRWFGFQDLALGYNEALASAPTGTLHKVRETGFLVHDLR